MTAPRPSRPWALGALLLLWLVSAAPALAAALTSADVVIVSKIGTNADGTDQLVVADSSDPRAFQLWQLARTDPGVQKVLAYYQELQGSAAEPVGLSAEERAALTYYAGGASPLYLEVKEGSGGASCDWKGKFTLKLASGAVQQVAAPKVVVRRNDPVFTGANASLQAQTVVHETGHAAMSKLYGTERLPYTEWLKKDHAGGTVSDAKLALIEGWAEFVGAYFTGRYTVANDPAGALRENRYAYTDIYARTTVRTKDAMLKTEGWVATALLELVESGAVTMADLNAVSRQKAPAGFTELVAGLEQLRPGQTNKIRDVLAEVSMGRLYPERYQGAAPVGTGTQASTGGPALPLGAAPRLDVAELGANAPRLVAGVAGAVLGAIVGASFGGAVGAVIGAAAGAALSQVVAALFSAESASAPRPTELFTPATAAALAPRATAAAPDDPGAAATPPTPAGELAVLKARIDEAFRRYVNALRTGDRPEQAKALAAYRQLKAAYTDQVRSAVGTYR